MTGITDLVREHYEAGVGEQEELLAKVSAAVDSFPGQIATPAQFAGMDQFHVGGLAATAELASRADVRPGMTILDAGSGLGGPARHLAQTFGCDVIGIDLSPAYVAVANLLSDRAGLAGKATFRVGDLSQLPFENAALDLVWTQHVVMNIRDRDGFYGEVWRVLKPRARFCFYDVIATDHAVPPHFPVPWASSPAASTLLTMDETLAALAKAQLHRVSLEDVTEGARGWAAAQQSSVSPGIGPALLVGPGMAEMLANLRRNLSEKRVRLVMGVFEAQ